MFPNTEVRLLNGVPLNKDLVHTMDFADANSQADYFMSFTSHSYANFTYVREKSVIKVFDSYDALYDCNYLMYRNQDFGTKWFYGFITERTYINPNCTEITFEIDVFQTWQFNLVWATSFVEREHCKQFDSTGYPITYTLDEGLNYGTEYETVHIDQYNPSDNIYYLVVCAKKTMHTGLDQSYYGSLNGMPSLLVYYVHPFHLDGSTPNCNLGNPSQLTDILVNLYATTDAVNNIVSLYVTDMLPNNPNWDGTTLNFDTNNYQYVSMAQAVNGTNYTTMFVKDMNYGSKIWDAGPKYTGFTAQPEVKLNSYPYRVIELTDLRGNSITIKPEYIDSHDLVINISTALGMSNKVAYTVKDYLNAAIADDGQKIKTNIQNSLINNSPNDVPIMTDLLAAFLQGNRNSIQNSRDQIAWQGAWGALGNAMTANPAGFIQGVGSAYLQMQGINAKIKDISNQPPSISNLGGNTSFDYGNGLTGLWIIKKEITAEYQKKLADFFNMYGYKLNEVKFPNLKTRQRWNFVKTIGANIFGNVPQDHLEKIKTMFDNGVTIWHSGAAVGRYDYPNPEV